MASAPVGNVYPNRQWSDEEARAIIKKFDEMLTAIPELREGCLYYIGISIPTNTVNESGAGLTRTAHFMSAHPHTATLIGTGLASVYPPLLAELAAFLAKLAITPAVIQLTEDPERHREEKEEDEADEEEITLPEVPEQKPN